ncbi:thrombospondin type 3 repeat-containing protein [Sandaracinus amylolyticus]|uniref:thrombospondin type 3 repeat-containing protein n=1 Tax=Sandaracinus amylolyticus TaxID=927083 RepID=UPI001F2102EC|nr:thrombospondin type 3 repeat-containing protein [Sandaracinus amylolyticus]
MLVLAHSNDGSYLATLTADPDGIVRWQPPEETATITVLSGFIGGGVSLSTFVDVPRGARVPVELGLGATEVTARLPGPLEGAETYTAGLGECAEASTMDPTELLHVTPCGIGDDGIYSLVAVARDAEGTVIGYSVLRGLEGDADATFPAWRTDLENVPLTLTGFDEGDLTFSIRAYPQAPDTFEILAASQNFTAAEAPASIAAIPGLGESYRHSISWRTGAFATRLTRAASVATPTLGAVSFDATDFPEVPEIDANVTEVERPTVSWTVGDDPEVDTVAATFNYAAGDTGIAWRVLMPPDRRSARLPELPDALAVFRPNATATGVTVRLQRTADIDGYVASLLARSVGDTRATAQRAPVSFPDRDMDGNPDAIDACPDSADDEEGDPCDHDEDDDGLLDADDECPYEQGAETALGCPDHDGDGVQDGHDACPETPGPVELQGCPDTDEDGIPDHADSCPAEPGPIELGGCADTDADGLPDMADACPADPGPPPLGGCPDTDNDGIRDIDDPCPTGGDPPTCGA